MAKHNFTVTLTDRQLAMVQKLAADHIGHSVPEIIQHAMDDGMSLLYQTHTTPPASPLEWRSPTGAAEEIPF